MHIVRQVSGRQKSDMSQSNVSRLFRVNLPAQPPSGFATIGMVESIRRACKDALSTTREHSVALNNARFQCDLAVCALHATEERFKLAPVRRFACASTFLRLVLGTRNLVMRLFPCCT